ncbi:hypothetical protein C4J95_0166 [Pseudomonas orientalis]|uniref:DUF3630 family protein n=1 Tax=Pseudomonas orientalis TaxID=76758 RepID=UPI000F6F195B|nr:DUF3630 family protein [Pseudomonas orientalis]AZE97661.1 hypothetical protein C4J95_0166 [Pseudomonas orientalis]
MRKIIDEKVFSLGRMRSGRLYAELTSDVGWEGFPSYAEEFVKLFSGKIISRSDSVDTRVWGVIIEDLLLRLVYEDFPVMISLESQSEEGDRLMEKLKEISIKGE